MYKRNIIFALALIFLLGIFYQFNRTDGFLKLMKNTNAMMVLGELREQPMSYYVSKENYLLIYDIYNIETILIRRNIERMLRYHKKEVTVARVSDRLNPSMNYAGVILITGDLEKVVDMSLLRSYVRGGGSLIIANRPAISPTLLSMADELGFRYIGGDINPSGLKVKSNIIIRGKGFELSNRSYAEFSSIRATLNEAAKVHLTSLDDEPLLWEHRYGLGKYIFYNATNLRYKMTRGLISGMLAATKNNYIYPVIGIKLFFIDDFPMPFSRAYHETITKEYGLSIAEFVRDIWWPGMIRLAELYDLKYTCYYIEGYDDQVHAPFSVKGVDNDASADRAQLVAYGRQILKGGHEIGLHGYNHQPLVFEEYVGVDAELGYKIWPSEEDAIAALSEVRRYFAASFPDYYMQSYVPPSNILSAQGRRVLKHVFPELSSIAGLYSANENSEFSYVQEFYRGQDGIYDLPRISFGYYIEDYYQWAILNALSSLGVFSHFTHPDNVFYEDAISELGWKAVFEHFEEYLKELNRNYGWLRGVTASQGTVHLDDFLNLEYRIVEDKDKITIYSWGFRNEVFFILRTENQIRKILGATAELIDDNTYLLRIYSNQTEITFAPR